MEQTIVKRSAGRRKIEITKIKDPERLRVSFSKRRKSLFNKAAKLKDLCGVDVAIIVQYPGGKIKASGEESEIYPIIDRYLAASGTCSGGASVDGRDQVVLEKIDNGKEEFKGLAAIEHSLDSNAGKDKCVSWDSSFDIEHSNELEEYMASLESLLFSDETAPSSSVFPVHYNLPGGFQYC